MKPLCSSSDLFLNGEVLHQLLRLDWANACFLNLPLDTKLIKLAEGIDLLKVNYLIATRDNPTHLC